jgi:fatty acid desaturase
MDSGQDRQSGKPIPAAMNAGIAIAAMTIALVSLRTASQASHWMVVAAAAMVFSFANNTIFSLMHECVHGVFHPNRRVNEFAGVIFAAFFPTAFEIQRISHFGHHRRNRSDAELYDYYLPHESRWLKTYWVYCLLTGFYWSIIPVAVLIYLLAPWVFRSRVFRDGPARLWGFSEFVRDISDAPVSTIWPQALFTAVFQITAWVALDLDWVGWLACYWAFGVNWSSVQYSDHAWSPRDTHEGAWNLRFWPVTQAIFLNYNLHLVHHRRPGIPWNQLPSHVRLDDPSPSFWTIYWRLWLGPKKAPDGPGPIPLGRSSAGSVGSTSRSEIFP